MNKINKETTYYFKNSIFWLYYIIIFIFATILYSIIHESGHVLIGILYGLEIKELYFPFFPIANAYVSWVDLSNLNDFQLIILNLSGTMFTFFIGIAFFIMFYNNKLHRFLELAFFSYSAMLILDMLFYNILDVYFLQYGDFWEIFNMKNNQYSWINGIILIANIIFIIFVYKNRYKIYSRVEIEN